MILVHAAFAVFLFDLLRRLFRNVQAGQSFTESNIRLVHRIGIAVIVFAILSSVFVAFHDYAIISYLQQHGLGQGLETGFVHPNSNFNLGDGSGQLEVSFNWGAVLTGLLILALGEVFRQGLALKTEADLTV